MPHRHTKDDDKWRFLSSESPRCVKLVARLLRRDSSRDQPENAGKEGFPKWRVLAFFHSNPCST